MRSSRTPRAHGPSRHRRFRFPGGAFVVAAALAAACGPRTADPLAPPPVVTHRQPRIRSLQQDLADLLASPGLERGVGAAVVQSVDRGDVLFRYNSHRLLVPASALKLVTVAVAAERLGWDYRFTTTIAGTAPIEGGVIRGDLVVTGDGDPTLSRRYGGYEAVFEGWADRLAAAGLRRVDGRLVGDDRAWGGAPWGDGWTWEDLRYAYGAPVGALQIGEGTAPLLIVPGLSPGEPASVTLPGSRALAIEADVTTAAHGSAPSIAFQRVPGDRTLRVSGHIAVDATPLVLFPSVTDTTEQFLDALRQALEARGIGVNRGIADLDESEAPPVPMTPPLLEHRSPPLSELATATLKNSHNLHAESLLRALARTEERTGTAEAGLRLVDGVLEEWGVPDGAVAAVDGSGLSRRNYVAADALLVVLQRMARDSRHHEPWMAALPVGGADGTLARRFEAGPSRGRVRAKTGSLAHVRALAGYVRSADDETLAFAIMLNDAAAPPGLLEEIIDRAVDRLALFRR